MDACIHIYSDEDDVRERARAHDNARDIYAHDCGQLPFGTLDPRAFELIVRDLFDEKKVEATWDWYDTAFRINDGSDILPSFKEYRFSQAHTKLFISSNNLSLTGLILR